MVETITPVVHGGRRGRWAVAFGLHLLGATVSAALFGAALGAVGAALGAPWGAVGVALVALVALPYVAREALGVRVPLPQLRRQVPEWWRTFFGSGASAFLYGLGLGIGFLTYLLHGTLVVVAVAAVASGRPSLGAVVMAPFGLARAATVLAARRAGAPEGGGALVARLAAASAWRGWRAAHLVVLVAVVAASLAAIPDLRWWMRDLGAVAGAIVAATFGAAAVAKATSWRGWTRALVAYDVPGRAVVALVVPASEAAVALAVLAGSARAAGGVAVALLAAFSAAIVVARIRRGPRLECGCFGGVRTRDYRALLGRNAVLAAAAVVAWRWAPERGASDALRMPAGGDVVPAVLVLSGVLALVGLIAVAVSSLRRPPVRP